MIFLIHFINKGVYINFPQISDERVGNMMIIVKDPSVIVPMRSQITLLVRGSYSNPPSHGARIVSRVLNDEALFGEWLVA